MPNKSAISAKNKQSRKTASKHQPKKHSRAYYFAFLLTTTILWGAAFVIVKPAFEFTTPSRFLLYRYIFASLCAVPILAYYIPKIKDIWQKIRLISFLELLGIPLALSFLYAGLERTTSIEAGLLTTTIPIFVVLLGTKFLHEHEEKKEWEGLFLAIFGTLILILLPLLKGSIQLNGISLSGNLFIFTHNILIAIYYIFAKKYYDPLPKFFVASVSFFVGLVSFFLISLAELEFSFSRLLLVTQTEFLQPTVLFASLYMGVLGSVVAFTAYIIGQRGVKASEAALFSYLQPLVYIPLGIVLLAERVHWIQAMALGIILFGVVFAEWKGKRTKALL